MALAGTLLHASGGETFWPTQFGFFGLLPAFFCSSQPPSWNADELITKSCAAAGATLKPSAGDARERKWYTLSFH